MNAFSAGLVVAALACGCAATSRPAKFDAVTAQSENLAGSLQLAKMMSMNGQDCYVVIRPSAPVITITHQTNDNGTGTPGDDYVVLTLNPSGGNFTLTADKADTTTTPAKSLTNMHTYTLKIAGYDTGNLTMLLTENMVAQSIWPPSGSTPVAVNSTGELNASNDATSVITSWLETVAGTPSYHKHKLTIMFKGKVTTLILSPV